MQIVRVAVPVLVLTLLGALVVGPSAAGDKPGKPPKPGAKGKAGDGKSADDAALVAGAVGKKLDELCSSTSRFPNGLSGSVLVARGGKVLLQKGYGVANAASRSPVRADALFDWCSVTKQFTAAAVLKLQMQKKLSIDDPIAKHFKDVPKDKAKVTIRQLLNHTSGIATRSDFGQAEAASKEALVKWFVGSPIASEPGAKWEYSNAAYFALAALIEIKSGKSWEKYLREELFEPAGMKDARCIGDADLDLERVPLDARGTGQPFEYGNSLSWGYRGAGGVVATVADMLAWDRALRGTKVLSEAAKRDYYTVGLSEYALGWELQKWAGNTAYTHSGHTGEVVTFYFRSIDPDVVVAVALNEEPPPIHPGTLARELADLVNNAD